MSKTRISVAEAAKYLGITLDATYRLLKAGKIPARKRKSGEWSVPRAAVVERRVVKARRERKFKRKVA